jgi:pilus assembly protein CpaE
MKQNGENSLGSTLATFTVCADPVLSNIALAAPVYVPGVEFAGDFPEYLTKSRRPQFPPTIKEASSCVAFIDFDRDWDQAIETVEVLDAIRDPRIWSVGISSELSTDRLLHAMRSGCGEFLQKPLDQSTFQEALERLQNRFAQEKGPHRGEVISTFGVKGGVGATTLTVYLGLELARDRKKKVLIIDHHHQLGHVGLNLGIKDSQYHFDDLMKNADKLDENLLNGYVVKRSDGMHVLTSPHVCSSDWSGNRAQIEQILDFLRTQYDFILVDSSFANAEAANAFVQLSDQVNLVATPDLAALRDLVRFLEHMAEEAIQEKLRIIVNMVSPKDDVKPEQMAQATQRPLFVSVPSFHPHVTRAMNTGEPLPKAKKTPFHTEITAWAEKIAPAAVAEKIATTKKFFGLLG